MAGGKSERGGRTTTRNGVAAAMDIGHLGVCYGDETGRGRLRFSGSALLTCKPRS
jgi:hypothetical protein